MGVRQARALSPKSRLPKTPHIAPDLRRIETSCNGGGLRTLQLKFEAVACVQGGSSARLVTLGASASPQTPRPRPLDHPLDSSHQSDALLGGGSNAPPLRSQFNEGNTPQTANVTRRCPGVLPGTSVSTSIASKAVTHCKVSKSITEQASQ